MTFPWVFETIARARQDEIRSAVARHHYAQDHCEWRIYRVPGAGARLFGPASSVLEWLFGSSPRASDGRTARGPATDRFSAAVGLLSPKSVVPRRRLGVRPCRSS